MDVNVEFLDEDPIENVVTCLHYRMDKVIYFGFKDDIEELEGITKRFLKNRCGVKEVEFYEIPQLDLEVTIDILKHTIDAEEKMGSNIFIDVTGGESAIIMAFGMLVKEHDFSSHIYDIERDKLVELTSVNGGLSTVPKNDMVFDVDAYFEMHGASIDYNKQKEHKKELSEDEIEDLHNVWEIAKEISNEWNSFCNVNATLNNNRADKNGMGYTVEKNRKLFKKIRPLLEKCVQQNLISIKEKNAHFVSCKNGKFSVDDYYELETLANEFGGNYSKKEFVVPKEASTYAIERAKSMDIDFINMVELVS